MAEVFCLVVCSLNLPGSPQVQAISTHASISKSCINRFGSTLDLHHKLGRLADGSRSGMLFATSTEVADTLIWIIVCTTGNTLGSHHCYVGSRTCGSRANCSCSFHEVEEPQNRIRHVVKCTALQAYLNNFNGLCLLHNVL